jgi:hypothetical protein
MIKPLENDAQTAMFRGQTIGIPSWWQTAADKIDERVKSRRSDGFEKIEKKGCYGYLRTVKGFRLFQI